MGYVILKSSTIHNCPTLIYGEYPLHIKLQVFRMEGRRKIELPKKFNLDEDVTHLPAFELVRIYTQNGYIVDSVTSFATQKRPVFMWTLYHKKFYVEEYDKVSENMSDQVMVDEKLQERYISRTLIGKLSHPHRYFIRSDDSIKESTSSDKTDEDSSA